VESNLKIYLAEDDADDAWIFQEAFKKYFPDIQINAYNNGEELLNAVQADETPPTYIFLDINMPVLDGFDTLVKLKANRQAALIPTFMFSSSEYEIDIQRSYKLGATSYFMKPLKYSDFLAMAEAFKAYWNYVIVVPRGK
jgi:CheY-like chemotaxis protein